MQRLTLLKLFNSKGMEGVANADLAKLLRDAETWHATKSDLIYAYLAPGKFSADRFNGGSPVELELLTDVPGPSSGANATHHYVVETDVVAAFEDEFNAWYDTEHLPGLAAVPGVIRARRYVDRAGSPRYYACYDFAYAHAFESPAWLAVRATPWSSRVRTAFRNTGRNMFVAGVQTAA